MHFKGHSENDIQVTIRNLDKLIKLAPYYEGLFHMKAFANYTYSNGEIDMEVDLSPHELVEHDNQCGTSCCLLGIAAVNNIGEAEIFNSWMDYSEYTFPALDESCSGEMFEHGNMEGEYMTEWDRAFSDELDSVMDDRVMDLVQIRDELMGELRARKIW